MLERAGMGIMAGTCARPSYGCCHGAPASAQKPTREQKIGRAGETHLWIHPSLCTPVQDGVETELSRLESQVL